MERRKFMGVIAAGSVSLTLSITGCTYMNQSDENQVETSSKGGLLVRYQKLPRESPAQIEVTVLNDFGTDKPARVRIKLTNDSDQKIRFDFGPTPPFSEYEAEMVDGDSKLKLIPDTREHISPPSRNQTLSFVIPDEPINGCWKLRSEFRQEVPLKMIYLSPGESVSETYSIYADPDNRDCIPPGKYRAETAKGTNIPPHEKGGSWSFTLEISE